MGLRIARHSILKLLAINILFTSLWLITLIGSEGLRVLWFVAVLLLATLFIIKNKNTSKYDVFVGVILGCLAMPSNIVMGLCSIFAYIGGVSVFKKSKYKITLLKGTSKQDILKTVGIVLFVGVMLGVVNIFLAMSSMELNPSIQLEWFLHAIRAGVAEEIIFRFFFFAVCMYYIKGKALSKIENLLCYLVMILPHVLIHFDAAAFSVGNVVVLALLFGLPFAILQRKHDLTSAMGAHTMVDVMRFCLFGR